MPELSAANAAIVLGCSRTTIWEYVHSGDLDARRQGKKGLIKIDTSALRTFAKEYGFRFDADLAAQLSE